MILGSVMMVTTASLAFSAYRNGSTSREEQVVKTESLQSTREIHSEPDQTASQTNQSFQGYTYEQQGEIMKERKQERDRLLQESDNR